MIELTNSFIFLFHFLVWNLKCTDILNCRRNLTMKCLLHKENKTAFEFWFFFLRNNINDNYNPIRIWLTSYLCNYLLWKLKLSTHRQKSKCFKMWLLQDFLLTQLIENNRNVHYLVLKVKDSFKLKMHIQPIILLYCCYYLKLNYSRSCWQHSIIGTVFQEFMTQRFEFT